MPWWCPFCLLSESHGSHNPRLREILPHKLTHAELSAYFFLMEHKHKLQVLYYLGVPFKEQSIILSSSTPFDDVKLAIATKREERQLTAELFMDKLKAVELKGKKHYVTAVLQSIFSDAKTAKAYISVVAKWPAKLKQ